MTQEAPEFHTKTLSPLSPMPVYPPEPAKIPVLQKQNDPIFNMTSTHIASDLPNSSNQPAIAGTIPEHSAPDSPSSHSSFSDAYAEQPEDVKEQKGVAPDQGSEVSDDYAMTFDSDAEDHTNHQELSEAVTSPQTKLLSVAAVTDNSLASSFPIETDEPSFGQDLPQSHTHTSLPPSEAPTAHISDDTVSQTTNDPTNPATDPYDDSASGDIDIQQLLDNITANAEKNAPQQFKTSPPPPSNALPKNGLGLPTHASLPPRPNVPQVRPHEDIQKYHAGVPGAPPASTAFRAGTGTGQIVPLAAIGAPGAPRRPTDARGGLPPPPTASFHTPTLSSDIISPASYAQTSRLPPPGVQKSIESRDESDELDAKWGPEIQKIYDQFIDNERMYVTEGLWDMFPVGSRLFIGNLPSEMVTKRDLFHVFHHYGKIAQISIKQAYGFVQFHESSSCYNALKREEGCEVRGRKIHLEISKPQKNSRNAQKAPVDTARRSRSPGRQRAAAARNGDRYDGRTAAPRIGQDEYGRPLRIRDDYRPLRSPTPPRANFRSRDEYAPRSRDLYDTRDHRRSRSRSPPYGARSDSARYRERSPSPRSREAMEDASLQIPQREPRDVPDVQIIPTEPLDRQFLSWVENEMRGRVKVEVMPFDPRLPLQAVIRRQILEGVHAVAKLDMRAQSSCKISLQVFDRQGGINNIRFDEYQDLDPKIAAELALRAKNTQQQMPQIPNPPFIPPQYASTQAFQPPTPLPAVTAPTLANLMGQLDNATLQKLLGTLGAGQPQMPPQQHNLPAVNANAGIDLAGFLGGLQQQQQQPQQAYQPPPIQNQYPNQNGNQGYGMPPQQQQQQQPQPILNQPQQSAQQVQNIMAQLARYRQ